MIQGCLGYMLAGVLISEQNNFNELVKITEK